MAPNLENPTNPVVITEHSPISNETSKDNIPPTNPKALYEKAIEEATFIDGNKGKLSHPDDIPWLDVSLAKSGLSLIEEYFSTYSASTILSNITFAIAIKPISTLVFCSEKPLHVDHYFHRFLAKVRGVVKMFKVLLDPKDGKQLFYKVRKMHALAVRRLENVGNGRTLPEMLKITEEPWTKEAADAIRKDVKEEHNISENDNEEIPEKIRENLSWQSKVPFSQFGLVNFTTAFFGIVWLQPQLFGIKNRNDPKMKGVIHVWAIIVNMLGLQDEYNIYIKPDSEVIDRVVREVYIHSLSTIDPLVVFLVEKVVSAINMYVPVFTVRGTLCLNMKALKCNKMENLWKVMTIKDKIMYYGVGGLIYLSGTNRFARRFLNWVMRHVLDNLFVKVLGKPV